MKILRWIVALVVVLCATHAWAWGRMGHRLVADIARDNLTPEARESVKALLGDDSLADISSWADQYLSGNNQTFQWHFINIPPGMTYDRNRDCPVQPGVAAGSRSDKWRDCVIDRIPYNEERLADPTLDRADRAIALKFLVHLVGDEHQPFHTYGLGRGANDIPVIFFGQANSTYGLYNLHSVWDSGLIDHRKLDEASWLKLLEAGIATKHLTAGDGEATAWATESHDAAQAALVLPMAEIGEPYYQQNISVVETRLELAGLRLAKQINAAFAKAPAR